MSDLGELTEEVMRNAPPHARIHDRACKGLTFVNGKGKKAWILRWAVGTGGLKKQYSVTIGYWPAMSLDAARGAVALRRAEIAMGRDIVAERAERKERKITAKKTKAPDFAEVWTKFMQERLAISRKDQGAVANRQVLKDCRALLAKRVDQISVDDVTRHLRPVIDRAPSMASSIKAHLGWAWEHGQETDFISPALKNPFKVAYKRVKALQQKVRNEKFRAEHWQKFFKWLPKSGMSKQMQAILLLQAATGARVGEILGLHRDKVMFQKDGSAIWQGRFKTDDLRVIYFAPPAARLLLEVINWRKDTKWLFPKREHAGEGPMDGQAVVTAINFVRHSCPVDLEREGQARNWSSHTIRRSVRAGLTFERITDSDTAERVLGHVIGGVRSHYDDVSNHLPAIAEALDAWVAKLIEWNAPFPPGKQRMKRVA